MVGFLFKWAVALFHTHTLASVPLCTVPTATVPRPFTVNDVSTGNKAVPSISRFGVGTWSSIAATNFLMDSRPKN